jgi:hypothetical protein
VFLAVEVVVQNETSWVAEWTPVAGALLAAAAAGASWRSVLLARRAQLDADAPQLASQLYVMEGGLRLRLHIENIGRGAAKRVSFYVVVEGGVASGIVPTSGILRSGQGVTVMTRLMPSNPDSAQLVTFCLDRANVIHSWSRQDDYKKYSQPKTPRYIEWYFDQFYDGVDHDALTREPWEFVEPS